MGQLDGKVAIITGSTSGMGRDTAYRFAAEGAKVVVTGRNEERAKAAVDKIKAAGGEAIYVIADTTDSNPLFPKMTVRGHEFHYSEVIPVKDYDFGYVMSRGIGIDDKHDGLVYRNSIGSYVHQHALSVKDWLSKIC